MKTKYGIVLLFLGIVVMGCDSAAGRATVTITPSLPSRPMETREPTAIPTSTPRPSAQRVSAMSEDMAIAFTLIDSVGIEIYLTDPEGEEIFQVTDNQQVAYGSMWSPDGSKLAYLVQDFENDELSLWTVDIEAGEAAVEVKNDFLHSPSYFSWSSDSRYLVFSDAQPNGAESDIYRVEIESGAMVNLTESSVHWDFSPNSSPTEDLITFVSDRPTDQENLDDIWVMGLDGSNPVNLTDDGLIWEDKFPSWSPDGEKIAYFHWSFFPPEGGEPAGIWVINKDGSGAYLAAEVGVEFVQESAVWSPDGDYLAFLSGIGYEASNLWVVPSDGSGNPEQVTDLPGSVSNVSWSPDGEYLIFNHITEEGGVSNWTIYRLSIDGTSMQKLVEGVEIIDPDWRR